MPLDPINPVGPPRSAQPDAVAAVRRPDSATDKREREGGQPRRKRREVVPDLPPPPDDGRPHIDVRV
ncbi:MAG TPA: hypothetical protein VI318_08925 [Baekduia sp.]